MSLVNPTYGNVAGVTVTTEATIYTPATGKKFVIKGLYLDCDTTCVLTFKDGTAGTTVLTISKIALAAANDTNADKWIDLTMNGQLPGLRSATANNVLTCTASTGTPKVTGIVVSQDE